MGKIPVKQIIRDVYQYSFANRGIIFKLTWFAVLLYTALRYLDSELAPHGSTVARLGWGLIAAALRLLIFSMVAVVLTRQVLGVQSGDTRFPLRFGRAESRMFLASVGCSAAIFGVIILAIIPFVVFFVLTQSLNLPAWVIGGPGMIVVLALLIFASVRYLFFLPVAAVLAPNQLLGRSYDLSAGNSWRILAITAGVALPVIGAWVVLSFPWLMTEMVKSWQAGVLHWPMSFDDFQLMIVRMRQGESMWWRFSQLPLSFVMTMSSWALAIGASVLAYRELTERDAGSVGP